MQRLTKIGVLAVADIGVPPGLDDHIQVELVRPADARALLPARPGGALHEGLPELATFERTAVLDESRHPERSTADGRVEVYRNGVLLASRDITAWPYYASGGSIGVWFINAGNMLLDDFGGGG